MWESICVIERERERDRARERERRERRKRMPMCAVYMCRGLRMPVGGNRTAVTVVVSCQLEYWELNRGPLQDKPVL